MWAGNVREQIAKMRELYDALPENAKKYVEFLESKIGVPIKMVSTGPKRHEMTYRK